MHARGSSRAYVQSTSAEQGRQSLCSPPPGLPAKATPLPEVEVEVLPSEEVLMLPPPLVDALLPPTKEPVPHAARQRLEQSTKWHITQVPQPLPSPIAAAGGVEVPPVVSCQLADGGGKSFVHLELARSWPSRPAPCCDAYCGSLARGRV